MSDLQTKLGSGMNKLQEGIEQGKVKLQVAQEIAQLKKEVNGQLQRKSAILLELGQRTYVYLRNGTVEETELKTLIAPVQQIDVAIYKARQKMSDLQKQQSAKGVCNCGGMLTKHDKFCGQCGEPNAMVMNQEVEETTVCLSCEEHIAQVVVFCPVCGIKQQKG